MVKRDALLIGFLVLATANTGPAQTPSSAQTNDQFVRTKSLLVDRSRLPKALRLVPLERLSSGAMMLLDRDGDLVQWPAASAREPAARSATASVALDPRVSANIRLGDDPSALPPGMRAQAEPHIVRAPNNPNLLLATFQEGRYSTGGGAVDCGYSVSQNGGLSWTRALIPGLTQASGGPYLRATDPVAGVAGNGNLYLNTLAATDANFDAGVVVVSRSTNSGASFAAPRVAYQAPNSSVFPDKNWMAINTFPGTPTFGRIVVTFTLFSSNNQTTSPILCTYSDDGGTTWSAAAYVHASSTSAQGSQPVFLPDGKLAIVYWNFGSQSSPGQRLEVVVSNNGGATFSAPIRIANAVQYNPPNIRSGAFLPSATANRINGNLYVVYQAQHGGAPRILFTKSTNSGTTWTAPTPISNNTGNTAVFNPAIGVSPEGQTLTVAFYDKRANPGPNTLVDMFMALSLNGGANWQPNIRLSSVSTDASLAPRTSAGYMLGDYLGVAESTRPDVPAVPVWIDTRTGNPDPFVTRVLRAVRFDFDVNDILWQHTSGERAIWLMNGTALSRSVSLGSIATSWNIVGPGDFNSDSSADILWQHSSGARAVWLMDGTTFSRSVSLGTVSMQWDIAGSGDFNRDDKDDILWQSSSGERAIWLMNGTTFSRSVSLGTVSTLWDIAGSGDFNGDGKDDILWQSTSGARAIWLMNGTTYSSSVSLGTVSTAWDIAGSGEFNGDGKADILWQSTSGARAIWLMNGTRYSSSVSLGTVSMQWDIRNH